MPRDLLAVIAHGFLRIASLILTPLVIVLHVATYVYTWLFSANNKNKASEDDDGVVVHSILEDANDGSKTELLIVGKPTNTLFLMIPGNPGCVDFYEEYLRAVYEYSNKKLYCIAIGHMGHSVRSGNHNKGRLYSLKEQVEHKRKYIERLLLENPNLNIIIAGHSVGGYMSVEVLRYLPSDRILRVVCLCPTLSHIVRSNNGQLHYVKFRHYRKPLSAFMGIIARLPLPLLQILARKHLGKVHACHISGAVSLCHENVAQNILHMSLHEMHEILDLDEDHTRRHQHKMIMYYAQIDGWVGPHHVTALATACPEARIVHAESQIEHAFVLQGSKHVAKLTWEWIRDDVNKQK